MSFVAAAGISTRFQVWGSAGSPVVLVHGAAESTDTWDRLAAVLARTHRVYAYDVVGWGYTQRTGPLDLDEDANQLLALVHAWGLQRPLLVGHSSGAAIVAEAALRAPSSVGGVVLVDGDALSSGAGAKSPLADVVIPPYRITLLRLAVRSDWLIRSIYGRQCGPRCPRLTGPDVDTWRRPLQVPGAEAGLWRMLHNGVPGLSTERLHRLAALPIPKAVIFGADDAVFSRASPVQTAARIGAPAPTIVPGARHLSIISDPGPVAAAIDAVL
jgi:pimeloyl-ACP methyl ester carboxylesterase